MKFRNKQRAYTLAEIMLVILVLTIIFAAMAPLITKRKMSQHTSKNNVWSYLEDVNFDAYYNPGDPSFTGQLFFGITPNDPSTVKSEFVPLSKIVVRAGTVKSVPVLQRHFQFRYGRTTSNKNGTFAGTWYVNRKNVLLGGGYKNLNYNESSGARDNVAIGYEALNNLTTGQGNVAIGYRALQNTKAHNNNVAVGSYAGENTENEKSVYIGHEAGKQNKAHSTVAIGYRAAYGITYEPQNLVVGAFAGGGESGTGIGYGNTVIGYGALKKLSGGQQNIAIGYNALGNLTSGNNNTAIGYNACSELELGSNKTCIGYNSGPKKKSSNLRINGSHNKSNSGSAYLLWGGTGDGSAIDDDVERVYIGGTPKNYAGDAVLEIHNPQTTNTKINQITKSKYMANTTTVINGNLIVRGRPYFTIGDTLHHFHNITKGTNTSGSSDNSVVYYGFKTTSDQGYAKCTTDDTSYSWGKCPYLNTTSSSGSGSGSGTSPSGGKSGGGGGGADCRELQADIDNATNEIDRHNAAMHFATVCSDRRLKNISDRNNAGLKELRNLKVYNFTFKNDEKKLPQVGVIAQELQKVFPNAVFEDENGYLKIRWEDMFYATINAIKELDKKIVALVKRTTKVETQLTKLERENVELKAQVESLTARVQKLKAQ